jgi:RNA polymerase sigma factor (sigma-70 family)
MPDSVPAGPAGRFPATRRSVVLASRDPDPEVRRQAFGVLVESYWKPVYKYLRVKWQAEAEEARDLTQSFFLQALEKGSFERYDPARARFRTFLRTCLDGFAVDEHRAASRVKRGGGAVPLSLDFVGAEEELARQGAVATMGMDEYFHREWVRALFARAITELRRRCDAAGRGRRFTLFERYDVDGDDESRERPSYAGLAAEHGIPVTQVTNELAAARRELRAIVLDLLREMTGSEAEFRAEARDVLGIEPP